MIEKWLISLIKRVFTNQEDKDQSAPEIWANRQFAGEKRPKIHIKMLNYKENIQSKTTGHRFSLRLSKNKMLVRIHKKIRAIILL